MDLPLVSSKVTSWEIRSNLGSVPIILDAVVSVLQHPKLESLSMQGNCIVMFPWMGPIYALYLVHTCPGENLPSGKQHNDAKHVAVDSLTCI